MKQWRMVIDVEKCENCSNCFLACKDEHVGNEWPGYAASQPNQGPGWITVKSKERGTYPFIDVAYLPTPCMHCGDAPCEKTGDGAVVRRLDGIIIIDPVKAKGRKDLVGACPYGSIRWNEDVSLPQKCTFCAHLLDAGWQKPRCVQSCPTGALSFVSADDYAMERIIHDSGLEPYKPAGGREPLVYYRNLFRFTRCFVGGSVATHIDGRLECVEGARVNLYNGSDGKIDEVRTDAFGDFKFDGLLPRSGPYTVRIRHEGKEMSVPVVEFEEKSLYLGVIYMEP